MVSRLQTPNSEHVQAAAAALADAHRSPFAMQKLTTARQEPLTDAIRIRVSYGAAGFFSTSDRNAS